MPSTSPTATASTISQPRPVKMPSFFGSSGMRLDRTHAQLALITVTQRPCGGSQFTVKSLSSARTKQATAEATAQTAAHVRFGVEASLWRVPSASS
jgi:hypothetical protein